MTYESTQENGLPGTSSVGDPNANTYTDPADIGAQVDAQVTSVLPDGTASGFDHFARLGDKLVGAVVVGLDAAVSKASGAPNSQVKVAAKPSTVLPQRINSWFERNMNWFFALAMIAVLFVFATSLRLFRR